jgi:hypothetical protein
VPLTHGREPDESTLIRYLVGRASEEEAEELDELSVADEEFAVRLRVVEHDLIDAYVNGELTGETLEGFKSQYLRTPSGLAAVEFAEALRGYRRAPAAAPAAVPPGGRTAAPPSPWLPRSRQQWWAFAAAALLLAASAYLLIDNMELRLRVTETSARHEALERRTRQLRQYLDRQQAAAQAVEQELARAREALAAGPAADTGRVAGPLLALVLSPATRGGDQLPQFSIPRAIPPGAGMVVLRLPLVAAEFGQYEAILKDATGDRVLWRSGPLKPPSPREQLMLPVTVPTSLLGPRAYTLELTGITPRGAAEPLDSYPFRVVP